MVAKGSKQKLVIGVADNDGMMDVTNWINLEGKTASEYRVPEQLT